jgi:ubiquitin C-terminal hydrolase
MNMQQNNQNQFPMNMQMQMQQIGIMNNMNPNNNMQMFQINQNMNSQNNFLQSMPNLNLQNNNSSPNLQQKMNLNNKPSQNQSENPLIAGITYPHPAGLLNVGQSCYMNATIECLSNIRSLSNNLLLNYGKFDIDKQPMCVSYSSLLYDLLHTKEAHIKPILFKQIIGKMNPLFEGNHAADAKDLILFIIETLHNELKKPSIQNDKEIDFAQQEIDAQNEQKMLKDFIVEYNLNQTIVSNKFYGVNRAIMKCNACQLTKYSFQTFNLLIFPLKKVKEYKQKNKGFFSRLDLNLYDAFLCEQEGETLDGENMIYCNNCRQLAPGFHKQDFYTLPPILIIILNRGRNNQDFNEEFRFDEILDFTDKNIIQNNNSYKKYYLYGIITHLGESGSGGPLYCLLQKWSK